MRIKAKAALISALACAVFAACSLFYISDDEAIDIALQNEGITGANCTILRCELIKDGDGARWELEFYKDFLEYDYVIDAKSGEIISNDYDIYGFDPFTVPSPNEGVPL
ncbi:MAG: PepSY domain-containing protein [Oscillospiraceae bacterium]|nr:PepSY domain-containing protein [Oscillospiraceae bacterium]